MGDRHTSRNRRKRQLIMLGVFAALILLLILDIFLLFRMGSMQKQINELKTAKSEKVQAANAGSGATGTLTKEATAEPENTKEAGTSDAPTAAETAQPSEAASEPDDALSGETTEDTKIVYLTFDDGPSVNTQRILDILNEYGVHATFFVNGRPDETNVARYKAIADAGNEIAMHSYSHDYEQIYESVEKFSADLDQIQSLIAEVTGKTPMVYRFPGGSSNTLSVRKLPMTDFISVLDDRGIVYFDWNVDSTDGEGANIDPQVLIAKTKEGLGKSRHNVVLMHDAPDHNTTVEALPEIIRYCQEQGYVFDVITPETPEVHHSTIS